MLKYLKDQRGALPVLLLIAAVGIISFLIISSSLPFKNGLLGSLFPKKSSDAATLINIDGNQKSQTMDGFGANINPKNWSRYGGNLTPALDLLTDDMGGTIFRVDIFGTSNWESTNDNADPSTFNWTYYNQLYQTEYFNDLWNTISYLNNKGAKVVLSASGVVPDWMGGQSIQNDDEWVEMIASVAYYARNTKGLNLYALDPLNETDGGPPEGAFVDPNQMVTLLHKLGTRLDQLGMSDVRFLPPQIANIDRASEYLNAIMADSYVMGKTDHFGFHNYAGYNDNISSTISSSNKNWWMTEWSQNATDGWLDNGAQVKDDWNFAWVMVYDLFKILSTNGPNAALAWDGYDNVHDHCNCTAISRWGLLSLNNGTYTPKKSFYSNKLIFKTVLPGFIRVATGNEPDILAFYDPAGGKVSIVGRNPTANSLDYTFNLSNISPVTSLAYYQTSQSVNYARQADIAVSNNSFSVTIPANTFYAITNVTAGGTPLPSSTPNPSSGSGTNITFDDLTGVNSPLTGQYPQGLIDWGVGQWWLAAPWGQFTTNSISFVNSTLTSASFNFLTPQILTSLQAFNGGNNTTVTLACQGNPTVSKNINGNQLITIQTLWSTPCSQVTITSGNGWNTNFDNLVLGSGSGGNPTPSPTPNITPTPSPTLTPAPITNPSITGTVTNSSGAGLSNVKVATKINKKSVSTNTDSQGHYTLQNLPAGSYSVTYSKPKYTSQTITVSVSAGSPTTQNVVLR